MLGLMMMVQMTPPPLGKCSGKGSSDCLRGDLYRCGGIESDTWVHSSLLTCPEHWLVCCLYRHVVMESDTWVHSSLPVLTCQDIIQPILLSISKLVLNASHLIFTVWYLQCDVYSVMFTVWCLQCGVYSVMFTVWCLQCDVYSVVFTVWYLGCDVCLFSATEGVAQCEKKV